MNASRPATFLDRVITFGPAGDGTRHCREGWFENQLSTWARAPGSTIEIDAPPGEAFLAVIRLQPFCSDPSITSRWVRISSGQGVVFDGSIREDATLAVEVQATSNGVVRLAFEFMPVPPPLPNPPFGAQLKMIWLFRSAVAFAGRSVMRHPPMAGMRPDTCHEAATLVSGLPVPDLLGRFESLGHSCDFGYAQREVGIEPLGLFRWSGISTACVFHGLLQRFRGIGIKEEIQATVPPGQTEWWTVQKTYEISSHTFQPQGSASAEQVAEKDARRLKFLRRKFMEDVRSSAKIFILKRPHPIHDAEGLAVWLALNTFGSNALLCVSPQADAEPGAVDVIRPDFMRGYADLAPGRGPLLETWLSVCANAYAATEPQSPRS